MTANSPIRILVIEDDPFHQEAIESHIRNHWQSRTFEFVIISNEKEFIGKLDALRQGRFDLVIIDEMIAYTTQDDEEWETYKARKGSAFRGGVRCYKMLLEDETTAKWPVVFYTILDREAVPPGVGYAKKTGNIKMIELLRRVGEAIKP